MVGGVPRHLDPGRRHGAHPGPEEQPRDGHLQGVDPGSARDEDGALRQPASHRGGCAREVGDGQPRPRERSRHGVGWWVSGGGGGGGGGGRRGDAA